MATALVNDIVAGKPDSIDVAVFPPFPYVAELAWQHASSGLGVGAQDVSEHEGQGAYTGEVSAAMLADVGAQWVLVGHSERRQYHGEDDGLVARKLPRHVPLGSRRSCAWARAWNNVKPARPRRSSRASCKPYWPITALPASIRP